MGESSRSENVCVRSAGNVSEAQTSSKETQQRIYLFISHVTQVPHTNIHGHTHRYRDTIYYKVFLGLYSPLPVDVMNVN